MGSNSTNRFEKLRRYIDAREMRRTGGMPESASFHSKGYHRYFQGYSEYTYTDKKGHKRIGRIYTGVYHTAQLTDSQRKWRKLTYMLLVCFSSILFLAGVLMPVKANSFRPIGIAQALCLALLFWSACSVLNYVTSSKDLTIYEYGYVSKMCRAVRTASGMLACTSIAVLLYAAVNDRIFLSQELMSACLIAGAAVFLYFIRMLEANVKYTSWLSREEAPLESNQIDA